MSHHAPLTVAAVVRGRRNPAHLSIGARLKQARRASGLARHPLSVAAGVSGPVVRNIEDGGAVPGIDIAERLAVALAVPACWLVFGHYGGAPFRDKVPRAEQIDGLPAETAVDPAAPLTCSGVGARLLQARTEAGLSLRALARAADMTPSGVSSIETGRTVPSVATVETLAMALGRAPCWLGFGTEG